MQSPAFLGVDVAKDHVVVAWSDSSHPTRSLTNQHTSLKSWLATLPEDASLAVESTGRYHEPLVALALARGLRVYLLNPRTVHHYAKAMVRGNKSDASDAQMLARYLANEHRHLRPYTAPSALEYQLLKLQRRRATLVAQRRALRQSLSDLPQLREHTHNIISALSNAIAAIEHQVRKLIAREPERAELAQRLRSLPGFGPENSHHAATLLPRIAAHSADACVAYAGLDLRARESGRFHGKRKLTKHGPAETRRLLFLAARSAARTDPHWATLYQRLLAKGRSSTQATVILARKLLRLAYYLYRSGETYNPQTFAKNAGLMT